MDGPRASRGWRHMPGVRHMAGIRVMRVAVADLTALEAVMKVDVERERLEHEAEALALAEMTPEIEQRMDEVYRRLDEMGSDKAEPRAAAILHGLGFTPEMQRKKCRDFSGGWRMRISLARALYLDPTFLILDEPTNHLDMETIDSLAEAINDWDGGVVLVSHDFRLISQVADEIWIVNHGVTRWDGDIVSFKEHLKATHEALAKRDDLK